MALVNMKCPNCGAALDNANREVGQFRCPYCNSVVLNIIEAKIEGDIEAVNVDTFIRRLNEQRQSFVVHTGEQFKIVDAQTAIINGKLEEAKRNLASGNYDTVLDLLEKVPNDIVAAERLKLLAWHKAKNEYDLTLGKVPLDNNEESYHEKFYTVYHEKSCAVYEHFLSICDKETAGSYRKINEIRKKNLAIKNEIALCADFFDGIHLYKEAYNYACKMCREYPSDAYSWCCLHFAKRTIDPVYDSHITKEIELMQKCPNYRYAGIGRTDSYKEQIKIFAPLKTAFERMPPEISKNYPDTAMLRCSKCGKLFDFASGSFVCPSCGHEMTNDEIHEAAKKRIEDRPEEVEIREQKQKQLFEIRAQEQKRLYEKVKETEKKIFDKCDIVFIVVFIADILLTWFTFATAVPFFVYTICLSVFLAVSLITYIMRYVIIFHKRKKLNAQKASKKHLTRYNIPDIITILLTVALLITMQVLVNNIDILEYLLD